MPAAPADVLVVAQRNEQDDAFARKTIRPHRGRIADDVEAFDLRRGNLHRVALTHRNSFDDEELVAATDAARRGVEPKVRVTIGLLDGHAGHAIVRDTLERRDQPRRIANIDDFGGGVRHEREQLTRRIQLVRARRLRGDRRIR